MNTESANFVVSPELRWTFGTACVIFVAAMYALSLWARGRVHDTKDFLVAGRRLPLSLATTTLLATWFGAGTLLTAADEVRREGVRAAALDPLGAGMGLLLAGCLLAVPLWNMQILTVADFFGQKFGRWAEWIAALISVPSYFGWIAVQFVALAGILQLLFGLDTAWGMLLVAAIGMGYTLLGGMWSVTLTDAVQLILLLAGLLVLAGTVVFELGEGSWALAGARLIGELPAAMLQPLPLDATREFVKWFSALASGTLMCFTAQDLMQRLFAAKTAGIARRACLLAGAGYLLFGFVPVGLGLAGAVLLPEVMSSVVPALAHVYLSPLSATLFLLALLSAVLSTIDSAILAPAAILSENLIVWPNRSPAASLRTNRLCVFGVGTASLMVAYGGESAYEMLEASYELGIVGLVVPLFAGLYDRPRSMAPALAAMLTGTGVWAGHFFAAWEYCLEPWLERWLPLPAGLAAIAVSLLAYLGIACVSPRAKS